VRHYTVLNFLKAVMAVLTLLLVVSLIAAANLSFHHKYNMMLGISIILCVICTVFIILYVIQINPSVIKLKKLYKEFTNGKTIALEIDSSTHMFMAEEEKLLNRINELINRQELLKASNKQAEYLALQNQINPHFLYNTLEAMRGDALTSGMESLANVAQALSAFFRYTISDMYFLVTVDEELENIQNYFIVQKYRFGNNLKLDVNFLDDERQMRQLRIPKLTLQPIVENSVYHGLEAQVNRGNISITFDQTETHMFISIKDSGKGMSEKELQELNNSLNETPFKTKEKNYVNRDGNRGTGHTGIALKNVSQRIKLLFGEEYGIYIFSTEGVGTNVKITLPRQKTIASDI
jgi:two-component system sensor histidine kinase YesM